MRNTWSGNKRRVRAALVLLFATSTVLLGQTATIDDADKAFVRAIETRDKSILERLLDPGFTWTNAAGKIATKADVLKEIPATANTNAQKAESKSYLYGDIGDVQMNEGRSHVLRVWVKRAEGWKAIVYQELVSLEAPPSFTPGAGKDCENPCKTIPFKPSNDTERQVALAYSKLETAAHARNSAGFGPMVADEFVAASSNGDKLQSKGSRIQEFDRSKDGGVAPTPLLSARMLVFGDAVLMISEHQPERGNPLHVTRLWVKRNGSWVETLSYQTARPTVASGH